MPGRNHQHGSQTTSLEAPRCAVISISDARTEDNDRPGALMRQRLEKAGCRILRYGVIGDDPATARRILGALAEEQQAEVVVFNGSANLTATARSFDAVSEMLERRLPGFGEMFRRLAHDEIGAGAMMLRGEAGLYRHMMVFALPGSVKAVKLAMDRLIAPQIKPLVEQLRGAETDQN